MIDISATDIADKAHGKGRPVPKSDPYSLIDTSDDLDVRYVCHKMLEVNAAISNLMSAIEACGDRWRVKVASPDDQMSKVAMIVATMDAMSGDTRHIYVDSDDENGFVDEMISGMDKAFIIY